MLVGGQRGGMWAVRLDGVSQGSGALPAEGLGEAVAACAPGRHQFRESAFVAQVVPVRAQVSLEQFNLSFG